MHRKSIFTIAEVAQAHDGSLGMAHAYIDALASRDVDAIKFQIHISHAESSVFEPFRTKFSYQDKSRYAYWKRVSFTLQQWKELKNHCDDVGIEFMASAFCNKAVDWLEDIGVKRYKIGSGEVNNFLLLDKISQTKKPIILSSGMSSFSELRAAIDFLKARSTELSILQCTTAYPTPPEKYGLHLIQELKSMFNLTTGFSDHSGKISTGIAAVACGAEIIEFHVAFSKEQFGPDTSSSLDLLQVQQLVDAVKDLSVALYHPVDKDDVKEYSNLKSIFEKSLAINKSLPSGHILTFEDLEAKKPKGKGIDPKNYLQIVGKKLNTSKEAWDFLGYNDLL